MTQLYMIAILPPPYLSSKVDLIRRKCADKFHVYKALLPPVHITILPPVEWEIDLQDKLILTLNAARYMEPFQITLQNFGQFPHKAIFIDVKGDGILGLYRKIKKVLNNTNKDYKSKISPHITIAYRDVEEKFEEIWSDFENQVFDAEFCVDGFTLLKHNGKGWEILKEYKFQRADKQSEFRF